MTSIHLPARVEPAPEVANFEARQILFFDGECVMCNGVVKWLFGRDRDDVLTFASLQGDTAEGHRSSRSEFPKELDTFVFMDDGEIFTRSTAAFRVARYLKFPWRLGAIFRIVPRFITDAAYNFVAKRRFDWFGKTESCWVPPLDASHRFLE